MGFSLLAFDTNHIKRYVFGTDKLKEIRGASSLLDYLNRIVMTECATNFDAQCVYAHGGSGLFLVSTEHTNTFRKQVQQAYQTLTGGGASITATSYPVPAHIKGIGHDDLKETLQLLQWRLQEEKVHAAAFLALASHPFLRLCDSCGVEYAAPPDTRKKNIYDPGEEDERYCASCQRKRLRDGEVKDFISTFEAQRGSRDDDPLWHTILSRLRAMDYDLPLLTERPSDFNVFRNFRGAKDYLALVYADANNMGSAIEQYNRLDERQAFAHTIDDAIYTSVCTAITHHLKIKDHLKPREQQTDDLDHPIFPFDILLMGGDDICMVVPASVALDVALTIAETFHSETQKARMLGKIKDNHTLSVGVVLAPIKYPFGLLQEMAETTLKFAKKDGADARAKNKDAEIDDTRINFMIVTGSSSSDFTSVYNAVYHKLDEDVVQEFHATLRPYAPADLSNLLRAIRDKDGSNLGRTKLHQVREAVLKIDLTTSVSDGLAVLVNWREKQRNHVVRNVYEFAGRYQMPQSNLDDPILGFPRVTFPWFADGEKMRKQKKYAVYRTSLLDFIELYNFVSREGDANDDEK